MRSLSAALDLISAAQDSNSLRDAHQQARQIRDQNCGGNDRCRHAYNLKIRRALADKRSQIAMANPPTNGNEYTFPVTPTGAPRVADVKAGSRAQLKAITQTEKQQREALKVQQAQAKADNKARQAQAAADARIARLQGSVSLTPSIGAPGKVTTFVSSPNNLPSPLPVNATTQDIVGVLNNAVGRVFGLEQQGSAAPTTTAAPATDWTPIVLVLLAGVAAWFFFFRR